MKIVASCVEDGWAIIINGDKLFLLKTTPSIVVDNITEEEYNKAICFHGFQECLVEVENINDAIKIVKEGYIDFMKKSGVKLPTHEELKELLIYADESTLLRFLMKTDELFKEEEYIIALEIASDVLKVANAKGYKNISDVSKTIIDKCNYNKHIKNKK